MKKLKFVEETFRDGQQSLWATRMRTQSMLPAAPIMDQAGFSNVTAISGAAFEASVKFLYENPWERLKLMRRLMPNTPLNFLIRGRNVVGWRRFSNDVVELMIQTIKGIGLDWIMIFDGLNDMRNIEHHIKTGKKMGLNVIGCIMHTESPVHTDQYYANKAKQLVEYGVDAILFEDASGVITPQRTRTLIPALRQAAGGIELQFQSHGSTGLALECYREAIKGGVDTVSTASLPIANRDSIPATIDIMQEARQLGIPVELDEAKVRELDDYFFWVAYQEKKAVLPPFSFEPAAYRKYVHHQIPGGMMTNLISQLTELGILHRLPEVLEEAGRVREELGYPVMVTPLSQFVGVQATFNVLEGERYQTVPADLRLYARGYYGELAAPIDPNVLDRILADGDKEPLDPAADFNERFIDKVRMEQGPFISDEDLLLNIFNNRLTMQTFYQNYQPIKMESVRRSPIVELVKEISKRRHVRKVSIQKGDLNFTHSL